MHAAGGDVVRLLQECVCAIALASSGYCLDRQVKGSMCYIRWQEDVVVFDFGVCEH